MSVVERVKCNGCGVEKPLPQEQWMRILVRGGHHMDVKSGWQHVNEKMEQRLDFCSRACLAKWGEQLLPRDTP